MKSNNNKEILFFGSMQLLKKSQKNPGSSFSASRFQFELLNGLNKLYNFTIIAFCPEPSISFPKGNLFISKKKYNINYNFTLISTPYINYSVIKVISTFFLSFIHSFIYLLFRQKPKYILVYNTYLGYFLPAILIGKIFRIQVVGIIADISPFEKLNFRNFVKGIDNHLQIVLIKKLDKILSFTNASIADFNFQRPYKKISPGINIEDYVLISESPKFPQKKIILFAGTLSATNGLVLLLKSFEKLHDHNIELWITGRGVLENEVSIMAKKFDNLKFFGFLERNELIILMNQASILINPRPQILPEHKYNFPSKIIEYLAVGKNVISTSNQEIKQEYSKYIFLLENENDDALADLIKKVVALPNDLLIKMAKEGREYVFTNKNWKVICKIVIDFLESELP